MTGRVLIADSDSDFRLKLYKRLLDGDVFSDIVGDGREAIERLINADYAVVVLDLTLPFGGGERILDAIMEQPRPRRPIVLVVAPPGSARSLDIEAVQIVLRRPCNLQQLAEIVQSCVRIATAEPLSVPDVVPETDQPAA